MAIRLSAMTDMSAERTNTLYEVVANLTDTA